MKFIQIDNEAEYNSVEKKELHSQLTQSWGWGEFQKTVGNKIYRFGLKRNDKLAFACTVVVKKILFDMSYYYLPRLECGLLSNEEFNFFMAELKTAAQKDKVIFLRTDPTSKLPEMKLKVVKTIHVQPEQTSILPLSADEDCILNNMHQKTRYNIRLAAKKGVEIFDAGADGFDDFWHVMAETSSRDGFRLHGREYYQAMIKTLAGEASLIGSSGANFTKNNLCVRLVMAKYDNRVIAANIVAFYGNMVTYVHGASSDRDRNVMAPFLLQWETIKLAKKMGYGYYDFFGIDEQKWPGVTRFKLGFKGETVIYPGTFDVIISNMKYRVYSMLRILRRKI